jgi:anti-sigma B factor antagonist
MAELSFDVRHDGAWLVVAVAGEVDMATAPQLRDCLTEHQDTDVIVDLSRVGFLNSSGITVLVDAYKELHDNGHRLRTASEQDHVLALIKLCGLDDIFHAEESRAD